VTSFLFHLNLDTDGNLNSSAANVMTVDPFTKQTMTDPVSF
jgi:hypothetical protein